MSYWNIGSTIKNDKKMKWNKFYGTDGNENM